MEFFAIEAHRAMIDEDPLAELELQGLAKRLVLADHPVKEGRIEE